MKSCCGAGESTKNKKSKGGHGKPEPKKETYLSLKSVIIIFMAIVTAGAIFYYITRGPTSSDTLTETVAQAVVTQAVAGDEVVFPESAFADGKAHLFDYKTPGGKKIRYFVIKSSDGVIRAAFDACDVCWQAGKGYYQKGDFMVCRNCGRQFQSTKVNIVTGGCNPAALTRSVRDGKVVIPLQALNEGTRFFN